MPLLTNFCPVISFPAMLCGYHLSSEIFRYSVHSHSALVAPNGTNESLKVYTCVDLDL